MKKSLTILLILVATIAYSQSCYFEFRYYGNGNQCGTGNAYVVDDYGNRTDLGYATSGYMGAVNDASLASLKDIGAIPPGRYRMTLASSSSNKFRLNIISFATQYQDRNGFLIHGYNSGQTRQEASRGCIILDANQRSALRSIFDECGELDVVVKTY